MNLAFFDGAHLLIFAIPMAPVAFIATLIWVGKSESAERIKKVSIAGGVLTGLMGFMSFVFLYGMHTAFDGEGTGGSEWAIILTAIAVAVIALVGRSRFKRLR